MLWEFMNARDYMVHNTPKAMGQKGGDE